VVVDVHILSLPSVSHPADASTAIGESWHSNVVFVELMDDDHDTIFTAYLPLPGIVERAEVVRRGRARRLLLVDVIFVL
jgi:hypothetical protein